MKLERNDLIRWGTIVLIIIFAIEIVAFLFTSDPYQGSEAPTPSALPSIEPASFEGMNASEGYVIAIAQQLLVICNTTQDVGPELRAILGVDAVSMDPTYGRIEIEASGNASIEAIAKEAKGILKNYCTPTVYKRAFVRVDGLLNFTSQDGQTKLLSGSNLQCLERASFAQCFAYVQPETSENSTIGLLIYIRTTGDEVTFVTAEEPPSAVANQLAFRSEKSSGTILEVGIGAAALVKLPWDKRYDFSEEDVRSSLNSTLNITELQISRQDSITLNATDNETLFAVQNLSFVLSASFGENGITLEPQANLTNKTMVLLELEPILDLGKVKLPATTINLAYDHSDDANFAVEDYFSLFEIAFKRQISVELNEPAELEEIFDAPLPQTQFTLYAANTTVNTSIDLYVTAITQGGEMTYVNAFEYEEPE